MYAWIKLEKKKWLTKKHPANVPLKMFTHRQKFWNGEVSCDSACTHTLESWNGEGVECLDLIFYCQLDLDFILTSSLKFSPYIYLLKPQNHNRKNRLGAVHKLRHLFWGSWKPPPPPYVIHPSSSWGTPAPPYVINLFDDAFQNSNDPPLSLSMWWQNCRINSPVPPTKCPILTIVPNLVI